MKSKELRTMSKQDLLSKLHELRKVLIKENIQISSGTTPKNPGNIRNTKKTIARILAILHEAEVNKKDE